MQTLLQPQGGSFRSLERLNEAESIDGSDLEIVDNDAGTGTGTDPSNSSVHDPAEQDNNTASAELVDSPADGLARKADDLQVLDEPDQPEIEVLIDHRCWPHDCLVFLHFISLTQTKTCCSFYCET